MINITQLVVKADKTTLKWLECQGYNNPHDLPNGYSFSVFIVDLVCKEIFGTNTACMAAAVSTGHRPIILNLEQMREKLLHSGN